MPRARRKNLKSASNPENGNGIGLRTANPNDRIALKGVRVRSRVVGMTARTQVEQTFVNLEPQAIEAVYTFPLPEGGAVCGFEVVFFDKVFTGVVEEVDKAIEKYDDAIAEGHGAYLLEQNRPDVFTVRVGNLKPRQAVTIRLTYVQDLEVVDRSVRLSFPTTIAPRYVSGAGTDPLDALIDGQALNPPHVLSVPYGLTMELELWVNGVARVTSPSHEIRVEDYAMAKGVVLRMAEGSGRPLLVTLAGALTEMDRDVVLELELAKEQEPSALSATGDNGERFVAVTFVPQFEDQDFEGEAAPSETVFVLDCSGSMMGDSIDQARSALDALRAMSAGDTFNICKFGSNFVMLSPEPLPYTQETLRAAIQFVRAGGDLGGTELHAPLDAILSKRPARGVRNIVLLTDGQVSNEPAIIELARRGRARNRIFTFGIGSACSAFLVKGLARVTGGAAEFITAGERIEDKVLRTFGRISSPPVTSVEVEWANADAEVAPGEIPAVFEGDAVRLFARLPGRAPESVTLRCRTPAGERSWTVPVREALDAQSVLPTFWARAMIRSIEDNSGLAASAAGGIPEDQRRRLLDLSKRYNLLCSLTSFIAVEHRSLEDRNEGRPASRRVPVMLAEGWGGVETRFAVRARLAMTCMAPAMVARAAAPAVPGARMAGSRMGGVGGMVKKMAEFFGAGPSEPASRGKGQAATPESTIDDCLGSVDEGSLKSSITDRDELVDLLSRQAADGSFVWPSEAESATELSGVDNAQLLDALGTKLDSLDPAVRSTVLHTLAALVVFRKRFYYRQATWNRAAKKAIRWLSQTMGVAPRQVEDCLNQIKL